jgi:hypothetical protein
VAGSGSSLGSKEPEIKRKLVREREEGWVKRAGNKKKISEREEEEEGPVK